MRLLVRDLSPGAMRQAVDRLDPNSTYRPLYHAALARQRADWVYGMNLSRLYTLLGRSGGYTGVLSVGRVQTPVLGLIVRRDAQIASFQSTAFFQVEVEAKTEAGAALRATWQPGPLAPASAFDSEGRLIDKAFAEGLVAKLAGASLTVTASTTEPRQEPPPLPYSLADLQIDASKALGLTAEETLQACQHLYESHRLITYPRSDCSHLPEAQRLQALSVLAAVAKSAPALARVAEQADVTLRSAAWNDRKVTAHHALIPTGGVLVTASLPEAERDVYALIARRFAMQFYPPSELVDTRLELAAGEERFAARGTQVTSAGWRAVALRAPAGEGADEGEASTGDAPPVPPLETGTVLASIAATAEELRTSPPKPFTDASLIAAMCNIARHVTSPQLKKILSETDGIGTPATRASIIETLFARGYVMRQKKAIRSTPTGRALIAALPDIATMPDLTALWELAMRDIQDGKRNLDGFLVSVSSQLAKLVDDGKKLGKLEVPNASLRPERAVRFQGSRSFARLWFTPQTAPGTFRPLRASVRHPKRKLIHEGRRLRDTPTLPSSPSALRPVPVLHPPYDLRIAALAWRFSTPTGRALIAALPDIATMPDLTALWELAMRDIQDGKRNLDGFLVSVSSQLAKLVDDGKKLGKLEVPNASLRPERGAPR